MRYLAVAALLASATAALAQDATDDWEIIRSPERKTVVAFIPTSTGLTIGFRCIDGVYGAIIGGLPEAPRGARTRILRIGVNSHEPGLSTWSVTTDRTAAVADYPARMARRLREGGAVSVVVPGGGGEGRNLRHELVLPASSAAIDETLTACGRPLVDPRDALLPEITERGLPDGMTWARAPRPSYPTNNYAAGFAVVTCVVQPTGRLEHCEIESEFPENAGFGRSALRAARDAQVTSPGETSGQYAPRMIGFRVTFTMN